MGGYGSRDEACGKCCWGLAISPQSHAISVHASLTFTFLHFFLEKGFLPPLDLLRPYSGWSEGLVNYALIDD